MAKNMTLWLLFGTGAGLGAFYYFKKRKDDETKAQAVAKAVAPGCIRSPQVQSNYFSLG